MLSLPDFRQKNIIICFTTKGQRFSFKNDNLLVSDKEGNTILQSTCHKIFSVWLVGPVVITSGLLERSRKFGFSVYLLSHSHKLLGIWGSATEGNFLLRKKQYDFDDLSIARHLVRNKIANQTALLKTIRSKTDQLNDAIAGMSEYELQAIAAADLQALLGLEGVASRLYFSHWFADMDFRGRRPRAKTDILNATLDTGYTYLFNMVECLLNLYGFDLYQGVYHRCFYQRKSLVCDIVEPFRCIIDKQVKRAYGLKQLQLDDFRESRGQFFLKPEKNKDYARWLMQAILDQKEDMFTYVQEFYRAFIRSKSIDEYPFFQISQSTD